MVALEELERLREKIDNVEDDQGVYEEGIMNSPMPAGLRKCGREESNNCINTEHDHKDSLSIVFALHAPNGLLGPFECNKPWS